MKKIFIVDWLLLLVAGLSAYSGVKLHIAGHFSTHEVWHNWAIFHIITSVLFLIIGIIHIKNHWGWYKSLIAKGRGNKSRVTIYLSSIYIITIITGFVLLNISGANTNVGLWHYRIGIILTIISAGHIIKRIPILRKSLKK